MKTIQVLILGSFTLASFGCASDNSVGGMDHSVQISKRVVQLSNEVTLDSADVNLACSCPFGLTVESFAGDTTALRYSLKNDEEVSKYTIFFERLATVTTTAPESARLALLCSGAMGTFRDTISVSVLN